MSELEPTRTCSNPTANDILRRMLDEREVEYVVDEEYGEKYPPEQRVTWSCDLAGEDMTVTARDYCISINDDGSADYCLDLEFHEVFTPAQAIAATLGSSNCTDGERTNGTCRKVYLVETCDELIESWFPFGVYLHREAAEDCAEALRREDDGILCFARVSELKVVDA